jgi:hypothetical protein
MSLQCVQCEGDLDWSKQSRLSYQPSAICQGDDERAKFESPLLDSLSVLVSIGTVAMLP